MSELGRRIRTAAVLLPLAAVWVLAVPSPWFDWLLAPLALAVTWELLRLVAMPKAAAFLLACVPSWVVLIVGGPPMASLLLLLLSWFSLVVFLAAAAGIAPIMRALAMAQWLALWLWFFVWAAMAVHAQANGPYFIAGACLGVWGADVAAYFAGRRFGKRRLCPVISPGKTRIGLVAAFLCGVPVAAITWHELVGMAWLAAVLLAFALVAAGVLGDLAESAVKRSIGAKDSGNWLPGHGGLLDRLDALMLGLPVAGGLWLLTSCNT